MFNWFLGAAFFENYRLVFDFEGVSRLNLTSPAKFYHKNGSRSFTFKKRV